MRSPTPTTARKPSTVALKAGEEPPAAATPARFMILSHRPCAFPFSGAVPTGSLRIALRYCIPSPTLIVCRMCTGWTTSVRPFRRLRSAESSISTASRSRTRSTGSTFYGWLLTMGVITTPPGKSIAARSFTAFDPSWRPSAPAPMTHGHGLYGFYLLCARITGATVTVARSTILPLAICPTFCAVQPR